jgi:hypothetical protein
MIDRNQREAALAVREGFNVITGDALEPEVLHSRHDLVQAGHLLALTENSDLNELACHRWSEFLSRDNLFRWSTDGSARHHRVSHGIAVWTELPRPGLVASELASGESTLEEFIVAGPGPLPSLTVPLLLSREGVVRLVNTSKPDFKKATACRCYVAPAATWRGRWRQVGWLIFPTTRCRLPTQG